MANGEGSLKLQPAMLGIVVLPFLVISISFLLIPLAGAPMNPLAKALVENGHAEAAGRLKMLATWLLLLAVGCVCVGYFLRNLILFEGRTRAHLIGAFTLLAAFGMAAMLLGVGEGPRLMGERAICAAFVPHPAASARSEGAATPVHSSQAATASADNSLESYDLRSVEHPFADLRFLRQPDCGGAVPEPITLMWTLNLVQRLLLALVSPALVLGTIACLAARGGAHVKADCQAQAERLRTYLYLTATIFVSGLLFLSALLRWPAFAFRGPGGEGYAAHVDAFVFYWGVTYTLYIASYYLPIALLLTDRCRKHVPAEALPAGQLPAQLKTVAALFAPMIAGLLSNVIHL